MAEGLTDVQRSSFAEDGFVVLPALFSPPECRELIAHQDDLRSGAKSLPPRDDLESFSRFVRPPAADQWPRSMNQHLIDEYLNSWAVHPKLERPLHDCLGEPAELIQSMYFWKSSSHGSADDGTFHQDQTPIPGVISAWIALVDIGSDSGPLYVQKGSHLQRAVWHEASVTDDGSPAFDGGGNVRSRLQLQAVQENDQLGLEQMPLLVKKGDVVLFHGRLLHKGSRPRDPRKFRHVLANHYIPQSFLFWPPLWVTRKLQQEGTISEDLLRSHPRVCFGVNCLLPPPTCTRDLTVHGRGDGLTQMESFDLPQSRSPSWHSARIA
jgi:hypothetical protein